MTMTNPTPLSPAAQAVITAIEKFDWEAGHFSREEIWFCSREVVAAALRAAADQLGEEMIVMGEGFKGVTRDDLSIIHVEDLLAIATELSSANNTSEND
jgi:hypothetical protein